MFYDNKNVLQPIFKKIVFIDFSIKKNLKIYFHQYNRFRNATIICAFSLLHNLFISKKFSLRVNQWRQGHISQRANLGHDLERKSKYYFFKGTHFRKRIPLKQIYIWIENFKIYSDLFWNNLVKFYIFKGHPHMLLRN